MLCVCRCSLRVVCCLLFVVRCRSRLFVVCYLMRVVCWLLLIVCLWFAGRRCLSVACYVFLGVLVDDC